MNALSPDSPTLARRATADLSWYFHHFLCGFCYYLPLVLLYLLPLVLMPKFIGRKYGTHNLFFHDDPWLQFLGGFSVGLYWATLLFIGYLLHLRDVRERHTGDEAEDIDVGLTGYLVRGLLVGLRWWFLPPPHRKRLWYALRIAGTFVVTATPFFLWCGMGLSSFLFFASCVLLLVWLLKTPVPAPASFVCYCYRVLASLAATAAVFAGVLSLSMHLFDVISNQPWREGPPLDAPVGLVREEANEEAGADSPNDQAPSRSNFLLPLGVLASWFVLGLASLPQTRERTLFASLLLLGLVFLIFAWLLRLLRAIVTALGWEPRQTVVIAFGVLLIAIWLVVIRLAIQERTHPFILYPRLFVLLVAFSATTVVVRYGRSSFRGLPFVAAIALVANVSLSYAVITWAISRSSFGILAGVLVAALCLGLIGAGFRLYLPGYSAHFYDRWDEAWQPLSSRERQLLRIGKSLLLVLTVLWILAVVAAPGITGPVPIAMLVLFGVAVTYGLFTYVVRRTFLIVVALVVLFGLVAHVQRYPTRFPNLDDEYADICDLSKHLRQDVLLQDAFDPLLRNLWIVGDESLTLAEEILQKKDALENADDPKEKQKAGAALPALEKKLKESQDNEKDLARKVLDQWTTMEETTRIRAGRLVELAREETLRNVDLVRSSKALLQTRNLEQWEGQAGPAGAANRYPLPSKKPLVIVTVSGGGIRSAAWVFAVMKKLELALAEEGIDFPSHVRIVTGASGGMVGASYYVTTLPDIGERDWGKIDNPEAAVVQRDDTLTKQQKLLMKSDFLTPLLRRAALTDLPAWISPWPAHHDRGRELEKGWGDHLHDLHRNTPRAIDIPFASSDPAKSLKEKERKGHLPSLVFTPMIIEDGRRLVISNLDLRSAISNDGLIINHKGPAQLLGNHSTDAVQMFRLLPNSAGRFQVGTAARIGASFPYFSPAVSLPTHPRRRIVDAGYYDNYGVHLAATWVGAHLDKLMEKWDSILILQIRDGITENERQLRKIAEGSDDPGGRSIEELTSPPEGLISSWSYSSMYRNDGQLAQLTNAINRDHLIKQGFLLDQFGGANDLEKRGVRPSGKVVVSDDRIKCQVVNFEMEADVSLSWYLSEKEQFDIRKAEKKIEKNIARMVKWWQTPLGKFR